MAPRKKISHEEPVVLPEAKTETKGPVKKDAEQIKAKKVNSRKVAKGDLTEQSVVFTPEIKEEPRLEPEAASTPTASQNNRGALILGGGLLLMGIILLLGRFLSIPFGDYLWPFIFIIPGALVFLSALTSDSSSGEGLTILGAILTSLGLIFLTQQVTGLWASWAYAWALVAPTSIGVAQMVYGTRKNRDSIVLSGRKLINIGLFMFAIGFVFFELVLGIDKIGGDNLDLFRLPIGLVAIGVIILVRALIKNR